MVASGPARLGRLLAPRTIALIGASRVCARVLLANEPFGRQNLRFWLVHPRGAAAYAPHGVAGSGSVVEIGALRAQVVTRVADLPEPVDAAFVAVPAAQVSEVVADLAELGCGGAVVYSSGFAETAAGAHLQAEIVAAAGDMPLLGPNCYGLLDYLDGVALWPDQHGGRLLGHESSGDRRGSGATPRGVALVAQSSSIAISMTMVDNGLPLAYCATVGNAAVISAFELATALVARPGVSAIGLLLESVSPADELEALAGAARAARVPVVALVLGRSAQAARVGRSHSASLHTPSSLASALLRRLGIGEVTGVEELLGALSLLHCHGPLPGRRMTSLSSSGGEASLIADAATLQAGRVDFPPLTPGQREALAQALGPRVTLDNPLDYHTYVWADRPAMTAAFGALLSEPADLNVFFADLPREDRGDVTDWLPGLDAFDDACRATGARGALTAAMSSNLRGEIATRMVAHSLPVLAPPSVAVAAVDAAATIGIAWARPAPAARHRLPGAPVRNEARQWPEDEAKLLLGSRGIDVPAGLRCADADDALASARDWLDESPVVVLKALGPAGAPGPMHKSDVGGVRLCRTPEEVATVARDYVDRFGGVLLEHCVADGLAELLVSVDIDPVVGAVLTLGAGGELVELLVDTRQLLVPATEQEVREALLGLTVAGLLTGYRGRPAAAIGAAVEAALGICRLATSLPGLVTLEVNPLIVTAGRAVAVDVLLIAGEPERRRSPDPDQTPDHSGGRR